MPKSKVRKKATVTTGPANRTPIKVNAGPSSQWYVSLMLGLMLAGLAWLIAYYLLAAGTPTHGFEWMGKLDAWNFAIGFGLMVAGLLMTMRWH